MALGNLHAGQRKRHVVVIGVSLLVALSTAGVAVRPSIGLHSAELELEQARLRALERESARTELERFEQGGGLVRAQGALTRLERRLPRPLPELELHGLLRLMAERQRLVLDTLEIAAPTDPGLARLRDVAALREVRLAGTGTLADVLGLLATLRALGRPLVTLEFQLSEASAGAEAHWTLVLAFFESRPLDEFPEQGSENTQESP